MHVICLFEAAIHDRKANITLKLKDHKQILQ